MRQLHVVTKKGKGYRPAEEKPDLFHGIGAFDIKTGEPLDDDNSATYTDIFADWLLKTGRIHDDIISVCAAMPDGTGVMPFSEEFPERAFDVGIAEEHAVTFAAGMAAGGMRPVVSLYSTFLQRAYDQLLHDVCLSSYPVIFAVDRSGVVGHDGRTHQGLFDIAFLSHMPGMTLIAPMDADELVAALNFAYAYEKGPVAIRYPRGKAYTLPELPNPHDKADRNTFNTGIYEVHGLNVETNERPDFEMGKAELLTSGKEVVIFAVGDMVKTAIEVSEFLSKEMIRITVVNMRFISPFDEDIISELAPSHTVAVTLEDGVKTGGFGDRVGAFLCKNNIDVKCFLPLAWPDEFIPHGSPEELYKEYHLDAESVADCIRDAYHKNRV